MQQIYSSPSPSIWLFTSPLTYGNKLPSHPLLPVDQSAGRLDGNLLGLCPLIPTWLLTVPAASIAFGLLESETKTLMTTSWASQPANLASLLQGWPPCAFLFLLPHRTHIFGPLGAEAREDAGGKGADVSTRVMHAAQLGGNEDSWQPREPRQRNPLRGFPGRFIRPRGAYI